MESPILYIVLNKDLQMSAGKASAQAVHATMMLQDNLSGSFTSAYRRTVVVLEGTGEQIRNLSEYLDGADIFSQYYIDEGSNEVHPYSVTALAVAPFDSSDEEKREIFAGFSLFSGNYEPKNRFEEASDALRHAVPFKDDRRWFVKKTLKWLSKQK